MNDTITIQREIVADTPAMTRYRYIAGNAEGAELSHALATLHQTMYCGHYIPTLEIGGIGTPPHFRRQGAVRQIFNEIFSHVTDFGCYASLLHPFESEYYRQFGYERVSTTVVCQFPLANLNFLPRYAGLTPYTDALMDDFLSVYNGFAETRNLMFRRFDASECRLAKEKMLYLDYAPDGTPEGYILLQPEKHYDGINKMIGDNLHVLEFAYVTKDSMLRLMSFLRMFEGEIETVRFHDIGFAPELDQMFRHYMNMRYELYSDIMARVLDTAAMLKANAYPQAPGQFTLAVDDSLPSVSGVFHVEYGNGSCDVTRMPFNAPADLTVTAPPLARLLFGYDTQDELTLSYMDGVAISGNVEDFLRAFPKRRNGNFIHF